MVYPFGATTESRKQGRKDRTEISEEGFQDLGTRYLAKGLGVCAHSEGLFIGLRLTVSFISRLYSEVEAEIADFVAHGLLTGCMGFGSDGGRTGS